MISTNVKTLKHTIKWLLWTVILGLLFSGITAFPLEFELRIAKSIIDSWKLQNALSSWISLVYEGVLNTYSQFPFVAYGTDWLAFAHLMLAVLFIGPLKDPVKNVWVVEFGLIASAAIIPFAFIAGTIRSIPFFWQLIDCFFGVICATVLWICKGKIRQMEALQNVLLQKDQKHNSSGVFS